MEFEGELKGFPVEVVEKLVEKQVEQGNKIDVCIFEKNIWHDKKSGGINWDDTVEGHKFWHEVLHYRNFDLFFDKYPKK